MKTLNQIKEIIASNLQTGAYIYDGLTSSEIGRYNGTLMFGDNDEAFPGEFEWSMIVD